MPARTDLLKLASAAAFAAVVVLWLFFVTGCTQTGRRIVEAQTPGRATGAGATLDGPANSGAPSTQKAKRTTVYQQQLPSLLQQTPQLDWGAFRVTDAKGQIYALAPVPQEAQPAAAPLMVSEESETSIGEHQDASGIVTAARKIEGWNRYEWLGLILLLGGGAYVLWSSKNPDGYPLVGWKVAGCGFLLLITAGNPWMLSLLVLALTFWALQHTGLLKFPGL